MRSSARFVSGAALAGAGWRSSGTLRVTKVAVSAQKPGNLAFYLDVRNNGRPVPGLQEKDFKVYEDGKLVSPKKGKRALLDADVLSANFTVVQVDMSGPIADSEYLSDLADSVTHFAQDLNGAPGSRGQRLRRQRRGRPVHRLRRGQGAVPQALRQLARYRPRSRNSNLYGAVYQGITALEEKLAASALAEKQAGDADRVHRPPDLSHTVGVDQLKEKLKNTPCRST